MEEKTERVELKQREKTLNEQHNMTSKEKTQGEMIEAHHQIMKNLTKQVATFEDELSKSRDEVKESNKGIHNIELIITKLLTKEEIREKEQNKLDKRIDSILKVSKEYTDLKIKEVKTTNKYIMLAGGIVTGAIFTVMYLVGGYFIEKIDDVAVIANRNEIVLSNQE